MEGLITNDGFAALRAYCEKPNNSRRGVRRIHNQSGFRSRRTIPPPGQGRWALQATAFTDASQRITLWRHAVAQQLFNRYGVIFRETAHVEELPGGFSAIYDVLKAMEESGKIRRGYFAADLGATQFAVPAAVDLLRSLRTDAGIQTDSDRMEMVQVAATDPANLYGGSAALACWRRC